MKTDGITIQYQGLHPSDFSKAYLESIIEEIRTEAPHGAYVKASFIKKKDLYKATVHVHSNAGPFFASVTDANLFHAGKSLLEQMRRRLAKWKAKRVMHERLRDHQFPEISA